VFVALLLLVVDFTGRASSSPCGRGVGGVRMRRSSPASIHQPWRVVEWRGVCHNDTTHDDTRRCVVVCRVSYCAGEKNLEAAPTLFWSTCYSCPRSPTRRLLRVALFCRRGGERKRE